MKKEVLQHTATALLLTVLAAFTFAVRFWPANDYVFGIKDRVRPLGYDSYFHVRHAKFSADHFPLVHRWDVGTHYPTGLRAGYAGLYDVAIAAGSFLVTAVRPSDESVEMAAVLLPPLLGVAALFVLYRLTREFFNRPVSLAVCALYTLYPGRSLTYTLLGFSDHHSAELVLSLLSVWGLVLAVKRERGSEKHRWVWHLLYAAPLAVFLFTWAGAPLHLVTLGFAIAIPLTLDLGFNRDSAPFCRGCLRYFGAVCVFVSLALLLYPDLRMTLPPAAIPLASLALAVAPWCYTRIVQSLGRRWNRWVVIACLATALTGGVVLACVTVPAVRSFLAPLYTTKELTYSELRAVDLAFLWRFHGPVAILALLSIPLLFVKREYHQSLLPVAMLYSAAWLYLWWRSSDYAYLGGTILALLSAPALETAGRMILGAEQERSRLRILVGAALAVVLLILPVLPMKWTSAPWPSRTELHGFIMPTLGWYQAMDWMKENTPEPPVTPLSKVDPWDEEEGFAFPEGSYGVMCSWDVGNWVSTLGNRTPVWSQWASDVPGNWLLATDPGQAEDLLCPGGSEHDRVRYIVLEPSLLAQSYVTKARRMGVPEMEIFKIHGTQDFEGRQVPIATFGQQHRNSMAARLYLGDGEGLGRYRLIYESPARSFTRYIHITAKESLFAEATPLRTVEDIRNAVKLISGDPVWPEREGFGYLGRIDSTVKIFEHVEGAMIRGSAPGAHRVTATLPLQAESTHRTLTYRTSAETDANGAYLIRVPYATTGKTEGVAVRAAKPYRLTFETINGRQWEQRVEVNVPEQAVQRGDTIDAGMTTEAD